MKRLCLIILCLLLITGCGNKESIDENKKNTTNNTTVLTTEVITTSSTTSVVSDPTKKTMTTTKKTTTVKEESNLYVSSYDNKKHKYSYVYESNDKCRKDGEVIFLEILDNVNNKVMLFDCEKVTKDEKTYYGLFFLVSPSNNDRFYY